MVSNEPRRKTNTKLPENCISPICAKQNPSQPQKSQILPNSLCGTPLKNKQVTKETNSESPKKYSKNSDKKRIPGDMEGKKKKKNELGENGEFLMGGRRQTANQYLSEQIQIMKHLNPEHLLFQPHPTKVGPFPYNLRSKKTLILNLETFVQIETDIVDLGNFSTLYNIEFTTRFEIPFYIRNYFYNCLLEMKEYYELIFFTSLEIDIAEDLIHHFWPTYRRSNILGKESCSLIGDYTIRELRSIKNRKKRNIYILDHELAAWCFNQDNYIPIIPFDAETQNLEENMGLELLAVNEVLIELATKTKYNSEKYVEYCKMLIDQ